MDPNAFVFEVLEIPTFFHFLPALLNECPIPEPSKSVWALTHIAESILWKRWGPLYTCLDSIIPVILNGPCMRIQRCSIQGWKNKKISIREIPPSLRRLEKSSMQWAQWFWTNFAPLFTLNSARSIPAFKGISQSKWLTSYSTKTVYRHSIEAIAVYLQQ